MQALVRALLLLVALIIAVAIIADHGVRGLVFLMVLALLATVPRTRAWRAAERLLIRLTGSRRRAAAVVMAMVIVTLAAVNVYQLVR